MVITKEQLVQAVIPFMERYGRLPYMREDDIVVLVDDEEMEYKAHKYIKGYFGDTDIMTEYLLENEILTYKNVADIVGVTEKRVKDLMSGEATKVGNHERRMLHVFLDRDVYEELEHTTANHCGECTKNKKCGQPYFVDILFCPDYRKSNAKKKK